MRPLPIVGDDFAGYRVLAVLGRGGMSTVYRAENPRLGNLIALKVIAPERADDEVFRARFLEESRIAAGLNHPNVVPIHDSGSLDGLLYIAMRHVRGTNLRQMVKKRGRLPPETAVYLLSQAARALDVAHGRGLYQTQVRQLDGGSFQQDTGTCGNGAVSYAEFGWNQEEGHPHNVTVAQMAAGRVGQVFAAGRMACFSVKTAHGVTQDIVWTIDNGPAMGVAIGDGSPRAVYQLWASLAGLAPQLMPGGPADPPLSAGAPGNGPVGAGHQPFGASCPWSPSLSRWRPSSRPYLSRWRPGCRCQSRPDR